MLVDIVCVSFAASVRAGDARERFERARTMGRSTARSTLTAWRVDAWTAERASRRTLAESDGLKTFGIANLTCFARSPAKLSSFSLAATPVRRRSL